MSAECVVCRAFKAAEERLPVTVTTTADGVQVDRHAWWLSGWFAGLVTQPEDARTYCDEHMRALDALYTALKAVDEKRGQT